MIFCARIPKLACTVSSGQDTHKRIHMVDRNGACHEKYNKLACSMGRSDKYGRRIENKEELYGTQRTQTIVVFFLNIQRVAALFI